MMEAALKKEQYLIFRVGLVACCVPIDSIDSVVRARPDLLHHFPNQASYIHGVFQYRDSVISIVNLFQKFAQSLPPGEEPGDYVLAHTKFGTVGFWVNEVLEIIDGTEETWSAPPSFLGTNIFHQTLLWQDKLVLQSEFDRLIAMDDTERLQQWSLQHKSKLFELDSANDADVAESQTPLDRSEDQVLSLVPKSSVIEGPREEAVISEPVASEISNYDSAAEPSLEVEEQLTTLDEPNQEQISSVIEITDSENKNDEQPYVLENSVLSSEISEAIDDEPQNTESHDSKLKENGSDNTVFPRGFTRFMDDSSFASDFDETIMSGSTLSPNPEPSVANTTVAQKPNNQEQRSATEILSIMSDSQLESIPESTFLALDDFDSEKHDQHDPHTTVLAPHMLEQWESDNRAVAENSSVLSTPQPDNVAIGSALLTLDDFDNEQQKTANENPGSELNIKTQHSELHTTPLSTIEKNNARRQVADAESELVGSEISAIDEVIDDYVSAAESSFIDHESELETDVSDKDDALQEKREASVRKVIDRIEKNKPENPSSNHFRLVASVLVAASAVFLVQHYVLNENEPILADTDTKQQLRDNSVEVVDSNDSIRGLTSSLVTEPFLENNTESTPFGMFPIRKHTVVWGDTLWHISEHYLKDPFRYPDLARWSNIENPDLIYPGDEVKYQDEKGIKEQSFVNRFNRQRDDNKK